MVLRSRSRGGRYVSRTEHKDPQNHSLLVPLVENKKKGWIVINEITSIYGKGNGIDFAKNNIDKKSLDWERSSQIQFLTQRFSYPNSELNILTKKRFVNLLI